MENMNRIKNITVRRMAKAEMEYAEQWSDKEGWNPGLNDVACYRELDPSGFFLAEADGLPAGCIFCVNFSEQVGLVGVLIVKAEYRGGKVGRMLCIKAMEHMKGRIVGFDALASKAHGYSLFGFKPAYEIIRYEMTARAAEVDIKTVDLTEYPFAKFAAYDRRFFPADRSTLMRSWIKQKPSGCALGVIKNDELAGYGVIRRAYQGYRLEPMYAQDKELAQGLLLSLLSKVEPGAPVYINIPLVNQDACALVQEYGMRPAIALVRMYNRIPKEEDTLPQTYSHMG